MAIQVVRNAAVAYLTPLHPAEAARLWRGHPSVEIAVGLTEIGRASRERRIIDQNVFAMINDAATKSPLSSEPFLVRGVQAQLARDSQGALQAFLAAQWRDPRSMPAAYFLADYYLRAGDALRGLTETAVLARLSPAGTEVITPFVATYAQNPRNWPQIRTLFGSQGWVEDGVLVALAHDARNADAVLALAGGSHRAPDSPWLPILLNSLVNSGDFAKARATWLSVGHPNGSNALIYDANFTSSQAPPPFNWSLVSSTVGLAERQPGKGLHAIFYGNEDGELASELLLLSPGTYHLQTQLIGSSIHPESVRWSVRCANASEPVGSIDVGQAAAHGWTFEVPTNCTAQWLQLSGRSGDVSQQADVTIGPVTLRRTGPNG